MVAGLLPLTEITGGVEVLGVEVAEVLVLASVPEETPPPLGEESPPALAACPEPVEWAAPAISASS